MASPLAGLTVVELGEWIAAPYAAKVLGDLGARVIKIEIGAGDPTRRWGPFPEGADGDPEASGMFSYLNTSKESWSLPADATPEAIAELASRLCAGSDILIVDQFFLERLGGSFPDQIAVAHERVIVGTVTPFGLEGPYAGYKAYDLTCSAAGGTSYGVGESDRAPLPMPMSQCEHQAGLALAIAIMMALEVRHRDGVGQRVDVATMEMLAVLHTGFFLPRFLYEGGIVGCRAGRVGASPSYPNTVMACKDGLVALNAVQLGQWIRFVKLMGEPEWSKNPRYRDRRAMERDYKEEVDALILPWMMQRTKKELFETFLANRIPSAPIFDGSDLLASEHLHARGALHQTEFPAGGRFWSPAAPYLFSRSTTKLGRAPMLGQHDPAPEPTPDTEQSGVIGAHADAPALAGLRVLDLGTAWAGGMAGRFFADFGADVVKVESWSFMDGARRGRPILVHDEAGGDLGMWPELQPGFHMLNRGKRSIAINLKVSEGRDLLLKLVRQSDVLVHNFSHGVLERLGLSNEVLLAENPRLVVAGQSVAGYTGPAHKYIGYGGSVASLSGLASTVGYEGEEILGMFQGLHSDVISALTTVCGALAALAERRRSGTGQSVQVSQWEATMVMSEQVLLDLSISRRETGGLGFRHPLLFPHANYVCSVADGDDPTTGWIGIAVGTQAEWQALVGLIEVDGIELPPGAATWELDERRANGDAINAAVEAYTKTRDRHEATAAMQAAGIAAFAVQNIVDVFADPQLASRGTFVEVDHALVGSEPMPGLAWRLLRTPGRIQTGAPLLGEHTQAVLTEDLQMSASEFEKLIEVGVVELKPAPSDPA